MRKNLFIILVIIGIGSGIFLFSKCIEGVDSKKTRLSNNSMSVGESRKKNVFQFQLIPVKSNIRLSNKKIVTIKNAWIEDAWSYESKFLCQIYVKKKSYQNLIVQMENYTYSDYESCLPGDSLHHYFGLRNTGLDSTGILFIGTSDKRTKFRFFFYSNSDKSIIDTMAFYKQ
jgi:hypothetical protein